MKKLSLRVKYLEIFVNGSAFKKADPLFLQKSIKKNNSNFSIYSLYSVKGQTNSQAYQAKIYLAVQKHKQISKKLSPRYL